jgi:hypothetical protein
MKKRSQRVIERLRRRYPGDWSYDRESRYWTHESGWYVAAYGRLAPAYPGDDDTFEVEYRDVESQRIVLHSTLELGGVA